MNTIYFQRGEFISEDEHTDTEIECPSCGDNNGTHLMKQNKKDKDAKSIYICFDCNLYFSESEVIRICTNHQDYIVPMIWTYAFPGWERWCPYCGYGGGMLGTGDDAFETPELYLKNQFYEEYSYEFLNARGTLCCSKTLWKGKMIPPTELPKEEIERLRELAKVYKDGKNVPDEYQPPNKEKDLFCDECNSKLEWSREGDNYFCPKKGCKDAFENKEKIIRHLDKGEKYLDLFPRTACNISSQMARNTTNDIIKVNCEDCLATDTT